MNNYKIIALGLVVAAATTLMPSCQKEYTNPSAASGPNVTGNVDGLMNLCAGLQRRATIGRQSLAYTAPTAGLYSVYSLTTINVGNTAEADLQSGKGAVAPNNAVTTSMWREAMILKAESESVLNNLSVIVDPADRVGVKAFGSIYYAIAMGTLAQFFEKIPVVTQTNASFSDRVVAIEKAIAVLESADADLVTITPSVKFNSRVPAGINVQNTVKALLARYYNMHSMVTGTYNAASGAKALTNATAASQTVKSEFRFTTTTTNPFAEQNLTYNVFQITDSAMGIRGGLAPMPTGSDPRVGFYLNRVLSGSTVILSVRGFSTGLATSVPVYLPGEMTLIQAEVNARNSAFAPAKTALDAVRTKTTDAYGIGAAQPAYTGALTTPAMLNDIYKQRRLELFGSGMELEDSRRFGRPAPNAPGEERNRNFYPYPFIERDNNTNTPPDPAI